MWQISFLKLYNADLVDQAAESPAQELLQELGKLV
jgi:hypothetical protein